MKLLVLALLVACTRAPVAPHAPADPLALLEASRDLDGTLVGHVAAPTLVVVFASWCQYCRHEMLELSALRLAHPDARIIGVSYKDLEEYDHRGDAAALRAFVTTSVPWLRVVTADAALYAALGSPPQIPTTFVFDARGKLVATWDRRERPAPAAPELAGALGY